MTDVTLYHDDCRNVLPTLPDASVDAVVTDPPYACVDRPYGYWTEKEWFDLMKPVVLECRRVLKPYGSAMFILQPNSEKIGRMRPWVFDFQAWCCREWNIVQDAWWWNITSMPVTGNCQPSKRMPFRPSLKACVWLGHPECYRNESEVLWDESLYNAQMRISRRFNGRKYSPSGHSVSVRIYDSAVRKGGVTPFNVLPIPNAGSIGSAGAYGHGAGTPEILCDWWIRYLTKPGDTVLDPFCGTGTTGLAALRLKRAFVGIEAIAEYHAIAERRLSDPLMPLFDSSGEVPPLRQRRLF